MRFVTSTSFLIENESAHFWCCSSLLFVVAIGPSHRVVCRRQEGLQGIAGLPCFSNGARNLEYHVWHVRYCHC
jgi:hypothetical protein